MWTAYSSGTHIGAQWMVIETTHCETNNSTYGVYAWCNGTWPPVLAGGDACP